MELREPIELINDRLKTMYGVFEDGRPHFRVVFSDDQFEKRWTGYTDEGLTLLQPEVRELPKYRQWIQSKYILERLLPVRGETDLVTKTSYEPAWVFQDKDGNYLPPFLDGCVLIIESILEKAGQSTGYAKYKDPLATKEQYEAHIDKVQKDLFGNETDITDHLSMGSGVVSAGDGNQHSKLIH